MSRRLFFDGARGRWRQNAVLHRTHSERLQRFHRAERLAAAGQLAVRVAHEIRNPLTAIRSPLRRSRHLSRNSGHRQRGKILLESEVNPGTMSLMDLTLARTHLGE